jgi:putative heme utilization carrier protein HutX
MPPEALRPAAAAAGETDDLRVWLSANSGAVIEDVARDFGVTPRAVLAALPEGLVRFAPGTAFVAAMTDIAEWGEVTLIVHSADGIFEFGGAVPPGEIGRGYYNLAGASGLHGHLRAERCGGLAFVTRAFMNRPSAFVAFLNIDGGIMFKVFVGRGADRALRPDQLARFHALAERLSGERG